jgi:hypothetical protein
MANRRPVPLNRGADSLHGRASRRSRAPHADAGRGLQEPGTIRTVCQYTRYARDAQSMLATVAFGKSLNEGLT